MTPFILDRDNGKLMGVCAGLARTTGADANLIRLLSVLSLLVLGPLPILLYLVAGWVAPDHG